MICLKDASSSAANLRILSSSVKKFHYAALDSFLSPLFYNIELAMLISSLCTMYCVLGSKALWVFQALTSDVFEYINKENFDKVKIVSYCATLKWGHTNWQQGKLEKKR